MTGSGTPGPGRPHRLTRSRDRKLAGVCGGLAEYLDLDPTVVRVVFVILLLFPFFPLLGGVLLYLLLWLVMPEPAAGEGASLPPGAAATRSTLPEAPPAAVPDAGRTAGTAPLSAADDTSRAGARLVGIVLLGVGVLFLLQRMATPWWMPNLMVFGWPVLLIVIGGLILLSASGRRP